jgi:hypothetical protein
MRGRRHSRIYLSMTQPHANRVFGFLLRLLALQAGTAFCQSWDAANFTRPVADQRVAVGDVLEIEWRTGSGYNGTVALSVETVGTNLSVSASSLVIAGQFSPDEDLGMC